MFKLKRSKADKLFSDYVRLRDAYTCQRCQKKIDPPTPYIQCSHFYGRGGKSTRFDPENAVALCGTIGFPGGCHGYFQSNPNEHRDFFFKRLGEKRFNALVVRAHTPQKIDEKLIIIWLKQELEKLTMGGW